MEDSRVGKALVLTAAAASLAAGAYMLGRSTAGSEDKEAKRERLVSFRLGDQIEPTSASRRGSMAEELLEPVYPMYKFVLTGGPCAGKTTALEKVSGFFVERGFRVFIAPEASTLMFSNGATLQDLSSDEKVMKFQWALLQTQFHLEGIFTELARGAGCPTVLLCDRGAMDGSAYMSRELWLRMLNEHGVDETSLRDHRYNAVFHLVTAADGAAAHYGLENNLSRTETVESAVAVDKQTRDAWVGHHNLHVFDNSTNFDLKLQRLVSVAAGIVGLPTTGRSREKYCLREAPTAKTFRDAGVKAEMFEVQKVYLSLPNPVREGEDGEMYSFVRRRSQGNQHSYGLTTVSRINGEKVETKRIIGRRDYQYRVHHRADPSRHQLLQRRWTFTYAHQSYQVHEYLDPETGGRISSNSGRSTSHSKCSERSLLGLEEEGEGEGEGEDKEGKEKGGGGSVDMGEGKEYEGAKLTTQASPRRRTSSHEQIHNARRSNSGGGEEPVVLLHCQKNGLVGDDDILPPFLKVCCAVSETDNVSGYYLSLKH